MEEIKEESDSDNDHFLMSSLSEAQLMDGKNEYNYVSKVHTEVKVSYV
jgi:hypothetical protein